MSFSPGPLALKFNITHVQPCQQHLTDTFCRPDVGLVQIQGLRGFRSVDGGPCVNPATLVFVPLRPWVRNIVGVENIHHRQVRVPLSRAEYSLLALALDTSRTP